jgi:hypothetical protein
MRRPLVLVCAISPVLAIAPAASASELIDRNASRVTLAVSQDGKALITYSAQGKLHRVLAWAAVNAIAPTRSRPQNKLKLDYSGGWGTFRRPVWKAFKNACQPYDGPELKWFLVGCLAPDGSYWVLQSWQRMLPNYGLAPTPQQAVWELRLSHWTGDLPQLEVSTNWAYRRFDHLFGRFSYLGSPVFGYRSTPTGVPLDTFGRNLYVDTFNSAYGRGWKRENSFLMHTRSGVFCYGFFKHGKRPVGKGERYRATIAGPGLTPDIFWESGAPGSYSRELDAVDNDEIRDLGSDTCRPN